MGNKSTYLLMDCIDDADISINMKAFGLFINVIKRPNVNLKGL